MLNNIVKGCGFTSVFLLTAFIHSAGQVPVINSFLPARGTVGTLITLTGTNFNTIPANNIVYFGAVKGTVVSCTGTSLVVSVPAGALFKPISVLNNTSGLIGYSNRPFIPTFINLNVGGTGIPTSFYKPKVDFKTAFLPFSIATGDLDLDGKPEIVVVNQFSNTVSVLRNSALPGIISSSSFLPKVDFITGNNPWYVTVEDVDGDGLKDIIVANNGHPSTVSVLRNTSTIGNIRFSARVDFPCGYAPTSVTVTDMDDDGKADLVTSNRSGTISILRNKSLRGSITATSFAEKVDVSVGFTLRFVSVDDIDVDGKPDIVVSNEHLNFVSVLRNATTPGLITSSSFQTRVNYITGLNPVYVTVGDLDNDGRPEIVSANSGSNSISVLRNTSTPGAINSSSFASKIDIIGSAKPYCIAIADVNGDGKPDVVSTNTSSLSNSISVYRNTHSTGTFNSGSLAGRIDFTVGNTPYALVIGDLDGDGIPEQTVTGYNANIISILQSTVINNVISGL